MSATDDGQPYISASKIRKQYAVANNTLRGFANSGRVRAIRLGEHGKRLYSLPEIRRLFQLRSATAEAGTQRKKVIYCRVFSLKQKEDLVHQREFLSNAHPQPRSRRRHRQRHQLPPPRPCRHSGARSPRRARGGCGRTPRPPLPHRLRARGDRASGLPLPAGGSRARAGRCCCRQQRRRIQHCRAPRRPARHRHILCRQQQRQACSSTSSTASSRSSNSSRKQRRGERRR